MKKSSPFRTVMLVFAIIFSVVLVPVIIGISLGGAATYSVAEFVTKDNLTKVVKDSDIFENMSDTLKSITSDEVSDEVFTKDIITSLIIEAVKKEDMEAIFDEVMDGFFNAREVHVDLSKVKAQLQSALTKQMEENMDDFYFAWKDEASSEVFSESMLNEVTSKINDEFDVSSEEELRKQFELSGNTGSYDDYSYKEWENVKSSVVPDFSKTDFDIDSIFANAEKEIDSSINKVLVENISYQESISKLNDLNKNPDMVMIICFAILVVIVLILLLLYLFRPVGFFVSFGGMLVGGLLCVLLGSISNGYDDVLRQTIATRIQDVKYVGLINSIVSIVEDLLSGIFEGFLTFGGGVLIFSVILLGLGILTAVLRKNKEKQEEATQ